MSELRQNPTNTSMSPPALAATRANRRAVRAWKASLTEVCTFFEQNPHRRHALFTTKRDDYVWQFSDDLGRAASRAWRSAGIVCATQWIPGQSTVVRLLFPVNQGPVRFIGTEAEARTVFDAKWPDNSGDVARHCFWSGGTWREVTVNEDAEGWRRRKLRHAAIITTIAMQPATAPL